VRVPVCFQGVCVCPLAERYPPPPPPPPSPARATHHPVAGAVQRRQEGAPVPPKKSMMAETEDQEGCTSCGGGRRDGRAQKGVAQIACTWSLAPRLEDAEVVAPRHDDVALPRERRGVARSDASRGRHAPLTQGTDERLPGCPGPPRSPARSRRTGCRGRSPSSAAQSSGYPTASWLEFELQPSTLRRVARPTPANVSASCRGSRAGQRMWLLRRHHLLLRSRNRARPPADAASPPPITCCSLALAPRVARARAFRCTTERHARRGRSSVRADPS